MSAVMRPMFMSIDSLNHIKRTLKRTPWIPACLIRIPRIPLLCKERIGEVEILLSSIRYDGITFWTPQRVYLPFPLLTKEGDRRNIDSFFPANWSQQLWLRYTHGSIVFYLSKRGSPPTSPSFLFGNQPFRCKEEVEVLQLKFKVR